METDPHTRLAEVKARLAELKQEKQALQSELDQLRVALGREPAKRKPARIE